MRRILRPLILAAAVVSMFVQPVMAQTAPSSTLPAPPAARGLTAAPPSPPEEKLIDGPVKAVDPATNTVQIGWFFGLFRTTLGVTNDTRIAVNGMKGSLDDIREGARVKAAYEDREGRKVAKTIDVLSADNE